MSLDVDGRGPAAGLDDPSWRTALERVLAGEGLTVVAQPIIDVAHARVGGYELLSRFAGPPSAPPDVWFAAARRHGLDGELTACTVRAMHALVAGRPQATFWTMNVEPHLLPLPAVREAVCGHGRLDEVVVELTEHVEAEDDAALEEVLTEIRALGGRIAMDDAGTGYSGLSQMLNLRPDVVKLDRSLVTGLDRDPVRRTVVRLLGDLSGQMDAWLLAEGVETRAELAELVDLGVPLVQGWAVGRPAPGWPALDDLTRTFLREQVARSRVGAHVLTLVRPAQVRPAVDWDAGGCADEDVLVDGRGRPTAVVGPGPDGTLHRLPALVVAPSAAPSEVLTRAMARPAGLQHASVVCTDSRGRVLGTVSVASLVDDLVGSRSGGLEVAR